MRPTSSLNYDAYYDNGYDSLDDDFPATDLMSVQADTDWRDPTQVYYQAVYGLYLGITWRRLVISPSVQCTSTLW